MSEATSDVEWVERLHAVVDELASAVARENADRLRCRKGCADCCVDGLTVFTIEAEVVQRHHGALLEHGTPHPPGACAFLDAEGGCRIYEHRPYVCRTQGLPLRWLEEADDDDEPGVYEARDICPKNVEGGPPLEELGAEVCWTIGPFEARLAERQAARQDPDGSARVALRALFVTTDGRRRLPVVPSR